MIKLNRTSEYGLIALRHMKLKAQCDGLTSAREIADGYGLPFEITAKTLQRLKDAGLIESSQGAKGGYTLKRELEGVSLGEFLSLMEGPVSVVACAEPAIQKPGCECEYNVRCELKGVMSQLNKRIQGFLAGISLAEITDTVSATSGPGIQNLVIQSSVAAPLEAVGSMQK